MKPFPPPQSNALARLPWFLFAATLLLRFWVLFQLSDSPYLLPESGDMRFYYDWALRIMGGEWTDGKAFYGLPGYPVLMALIFMVTGPDPLVMGMLQAVLEGFVSVLIFRIAILTWGPGATGVGVMAAVAWMLLVPAQGFSVIMMPTSWAVCAYWFVVFWILRMRQVGTAPWVAWLLIGLLVGSVSVLVATLLFVIPLVCAAALLQVKSAATPGSRVVRRLGACALFFVGLFTGLAPCWMHNYFVAKERVFLSAHSGVNFYLGNNPVANGYPRIPPGLSSGQEGMLQDSIRVAVEEIQKMQGAEALAADSITREQISEYWSARADAYIRENPGPWVRLMVLKAGNFWNRFVYDDLSVLTPLRERGILIPGISFGLLALLGVPGMVPGIWKSRRSLWIAGAVLLHFAALMPVFITERYRLAAVPGLALFAACGLWIVFRALRAGQWKLPIFWTCAVGLWSLVVFAPREDPRLAAVDLYNSGIVYLREGDLDKARQKLEASEQLVPDNIEMQFALGNLWLEKGQMTKAVAYYHRALEMNPVHKGVLNNLGYIALQENEPESAVKYLSASLETEPGDAKTWYLLALAYRDAGNHTAANSAIRWAMELLPDQQEFQALHQELEAAQPLEAQ